MIECSQTCSQAHEKDCWPEVNQKVQWLLIGAFCFADAGSSSGELSSALNCFPLI
jgi:hypothetical protein